MHQKIFTAPGLCRTPIHDPSDPGAPPVLSLVTQSLCELRQGCMSAQPQTLAGLELRFSLWSHILLFLTGLPGWMLDIRHDYHLAFSGIVNGLFNHQFCSTYRLGAGKGTVLEPPLLPGSYTIMEQPYPCSCSLTDFIKHEHRLHSFISLLSESVRELLDLSLGES